MQASRLPDQRERLPAPASSLTNAQLVPRMRPDHVLLRQHLSHLAGLQAQAEPGQLSEPHQQQAEAPGGAPAMLPSIRDQLLPQVGAGGAAGSPTRLYGSPRAT